MQPPVLYSSVLFNSLCIPEASRTKDVPFKVIGLLPQKNESTFLWKQIYNLYDRNISIYRYGRIELNMFLSEKQYMIVPNDHLCLERITPRRDLFTNSLTRGNGNIFIVMVKQCLGKRKAKPVDRLNS
ncbi:dimethyladenosine transferase 2, mitochondrial [Xenopus laevis]|uniref:Dimethyladenosine transferase 2, mitochondrial n=1 Tax=Xenopus laevis TaxID=8355 RepID=A0A8J1KSU4_XENLA|nr:dimethyladenosine transferase 2, mitochondrial [Xenopus laevis]